MENKFTFEENTYGRMAEECFLLNEDPIVKEKYPRIWLRNLYDGFFNLTKEFINSYNNENRNLSYECLDSLISGSKTIYKLPEDYIGFLMTLEDIVNNSHISIISNPHSFEPVTPVNIEYCDIKYPNYKKLLYNLIQKLKEGGKIDEQ